MNFIHESIFISSLRAFAKSIFTVLGIAIGLIGIFVAIGFLSSPYIDPYRPQLVICPDEHGNTQLLPHAPVILKISLEGVIGTKKLNSDLIHFALQKSRQTIKEDRIKGILLYIDSPGGTSIDSANIYQALCEYKQKHQIPVYAYVNGLCASGGMYAASASDYICASGESVIGSVGVRMGPLFNFKDLMTRVGVNATTLTQGKDKDSFNPFRTWTPDEGEDIKILMQDSYDTFVEAVVKGRPKLTKDLLVNQYGAQIFSAKTALEYGYIDEANSTYSQALKRLRETAHLDDKTTYQVLEILPYKSPIENFMESKLSIFSKSLKEQLYEFEAKNPLCDRIYYLMD